MGWGNRGDELGPAIANFLCRMEVSEFVSSVLNSGAMCLLTDTQPSPCWC